MVETKLCYSSNLKILCSYDGKIIPRHPDGQLRYSGGHTRILSFPRAITFTQLVVKLSELYGAPVSLRCQLPTGDLDALVSITSDEDLASLVEEYDKFAPAGAKMRVFLSPIKPKNPSPPGSARLPPLLRSGGVPVQLGRNVFVPSVVPSTVMGRFRGAPSCNARG